MIMKCLVAECQRIYTISFIFCYSATITSVYRSFFGYVMTFYALNSVCFTDVCVFLCLLV